MKLTPYHGVLCHTEAQVVEALLYSNLSGYTPTGLLSRYAPIVIFLNGYGPTNVYGYTHCQFPSKYNFKL